MSGAAETVDREDWPVHQPGPALEAPIPGTHWYSGCSDDYPRVNPETGVCEGCGGTACVLCGKSNCPDHPQLGQRYKQKLGGATNVIVGFDGNMALIKRADDPKKNLAHKRGAGIVSLSELATEWELCP